MQKINGDWLGASPSLGKSNSSDFSEEEEEDSGNETIEPSSQSSGFDFIEINIKAKIDSLEYLPVAGADVVFKGKALGLENELLENASYQWAFGDGTKGKGQSILHNFTYPGEYLVVMEVISGEYATSDRLKIKVIPSEMIISSINLDLNNNFIEIYNPSNYEVNLSWWRLRTDNTFFTFPKNTILLPNSHLKLSFNVTQLLVKENSIVQLLYPNGMLTFNYSFKEDSGLVTYVESPKLSVEQKITPIVQKSVIYSVEKPVEDGISEQVATIKDSLGGEDTEKSKFPLNKWNLMLGGITFIAVVGVAYATKLDSDNENLF